MKLEHLQEHIDINVFGMPPAVLIPSLCTILNIVPNLGPLTLFQAMLPLLNASPAPKFCLIGSSVGSVGGMEKYPYPMPAYGMSKAMAHYLARKIHFEHGGERGKLVAWAVYPGYFDSFIIAIPYASGLGGTLMCDIPDLCRPILAMQVRDIAAWLKPRIPSIPLWLSWERR